MKVFIISPSLCGGGAERVALNLLQNLLAKKINAFLFTFIDQTDYKLPKKIKSKIVCLNARRSFFCILKLRKILKNEKPSVTISVIRQSNIVLGLASKNLQCFKIFREANPFDNMRNKNWLIKFFTIKLVQNLYPEAKKIICNSIDTQRSLKKFTGLNFINSTVIGNPVLASKINLKTIKKPNEPWFRNSKIKVILGAGRFVAQKNFASLIKGFSLALKTNKYLRLIIIGKGPEQQNCKKLVLQMNIKNFVKFPGFTNNFFGYMKYSRLFVLSSLWEGFGNVMIEAMAVGTPVIATNCPGGPKEILGNGKVGHLINNFHPKAISKAIKNQLSKKKNKKLIIKRANMYSASEIIPKYFQNTPLEKILLKQS